MALDYRRLASLLRHVVAEQDVADVLTQVVATLRELVHCDDLVIWEHDGSGQLTVTVAEGENQEEVSRLEIRVGDGLTGLAAAELAPVVSNNAHLDARAGHVPGTVRAAEAVACMPLVARDLLLGVISLYRRGEDGGFSEDEVELLRDYAAVAALALENAQTRAELETLATTDDLTGLANRRQFRRRLEHEVAVMRRQGTPLSLLLLDLNDFKAINDAFGHHRGDEALRAVARAIQSRIRATDCVARVGGDEFAIVLPQTTREQALHVADSVTDAIAVALPPPLRLTAAAGVSTLTADAHESVGHVDSLLLRADRLLYAAKEHAPSA